MKTKTARRAGGFTLLEVGLVIGIFGIIALTITTFQIGLFRQQTNTAREQRVLADAQAILEASLDFYDRTGEWPRFMKVPTKVDIDALWPEDMEPTLGPDRVPSMVRYFPEIVQNLYVDLAEGREGVMNFGMGWHPLMMRDGQFQLGTFGADDPGTLEFDMPMPTDHGLALRFAVFGVGAARAIATLLPRGEAIMDPDADDEVWEVRASLLPPTEHRYVRREGALSLEFETDDAKADQTRVLLRNPMTNLRDGWQFIEGVDDIIFDVTARGTDEWGLNHIRGVDRIVRQTADNPYDITDADNKNLTAVELDENKAAFRTQDTATQNHQAALALDASGTMPKAALQITEGVTDPTPTMHEARFEDMGGEPRFVVTSDAGDGVSIDYKDLNVPGELNVQGGLKVPGQLQLENQDLQQMLCYIYENAGGVMGVGMRSAELDALCPSP